MTAEETSLLLHRWAWEYDKLCKGSDPIENDPVRLKLLAKINGLEIAQLKAQRDDLCRLVGLAYETLADNENNWPGRNSQAGQWLLCELRNSSAEWNSREVEELKKSQDVHFGSPYN